MCSCQEEIAVRIIHQDLSRECLLSAYHTRAPFFLEEASFAWKAVITLWKNAFLLLFSAYCGKKTWNQIDIQTVERKYFLRGTKETSHRIINSALLQCSFLKFSRIEIKWVLSFLAKRALRRAILHSTFQFRFLKIFCISSKHNSDHSPLKNWHVISARDVNHLQWMWVLSPTLGVAYQPTLIASGWD